MAEQSAFERIAADARAIGANVPAAEMARLAEDRGMGAAEVEAVAETLSYLAAKKRERAVQMHLNMSHILQKSPKTFDNFDFGRVRGQDGYVFALSAQTYLIEYHPDESLVGADAIDAGIEVAKLEDGTTSWMTLDGEPLYCHVSPIDDMYYIQAVPASDMNASTMVTVGVILFAFTAAVAAVALYGIFVLRDDERRGEAERGDAKAGGLRINRRIAKKAAVLSAVGFIGIIVISFYMQTLFALSSQSLAMTERVEQIAQTIKTSQDRASDLEDQYNERYLSKAQVAAYILDRNPEPATREKLQELADALQIEYLFTFDSSGRVTATNSTFTNFVLSEDPEDQSYGFRKLMQGVESYVQPAGPDEVSGELRQYIGVVTHDADGVIDGFVQLGIRPTRLEALLEPVQNDHVLDGVRVGTDGALMAERVPLTVATAGIALVCLVVIFCLMVVEPKPGADAAWRRATHRHTGPRRKTPRQTQPDGGVALSARRMRARDLRSGCRDGCR